MISKTLKANSTEAIIKEIDKATAEGFKPTLAIVFSSISQGFGSDVTIFGGMAGDELVLDGPIVFTTNWFSDKGVFTYGEFGKSKTGKHEFHNNTCCVVALKEKA